MLALSAPPATAQVMPDLVEPPVKPDSAITAVVAGTRLTFVESGTERLHLLLRMIDGATRSVRMLFYMMDADAVGEAVRDALVRAATRGCAVSVILDGFGSDIPSDFFDGLKQAGGSSCLFNPRIGVRYLLRNHQKLVVIDDKEAITGGANLTVEYMSDRSPDRWRDLWLHIEGPAVRPAARYYDALHAWTVRKGP